MAVSTRVNEQRAITGMLLFSGVHFAQVLEGPAPALAALMASIAADPRHREVRVLSRTAVTRRDFTGWSMAYVHDLGAADLLAELWSATEVSGARVRRTIAYLLRSLPEPLAH